MVVAVKVKFTTLTGPQAVTWTLKEALESDLAGNVRSLMTDSACVGCTLDHHFYGRVELELISMTVKLPGGAA